MPVKQFLRSGIRALLTKVCKINILEKIIRVFFLARPLQ
ncbi:hypothetical protein DWUX_1783 [Desulfovibrio diazotrophicus]|nr:hypothetical protein DWUX_1783 [Desulfovibrio diazotrophicus]VVU42898.1 hypothetical protein DWUX_244 [Desulfovibrio diazotrophicus]